MHGPDLKLFPSEVQGAGGKPYVRADAFPDKMTSPKMLKKE